MAQPVALDVGMRRIADALRGLVETCGYCGRKKYLGIWCGCDGAHAADISSRVTHTERDKAERRNP